MNDGVSRTINMNFNEDNACRYTLITEHDIKSSNISSEVELLLSSSFCSDGEGIYTCLKNFIDDMKKLSKSEDDTFIVEVSLCDDSEDTIFIFDKGKVSSTPSLRFFENRCLACFSDDTSVKIINVEFVSKNGNISVRNEKLMHCFNCGSLLIFNDYSNSSGLLPN